MRLLRAGEAALLVELPAAQPVLPLVAGLQATRPDAVTELVPAERTILVGFDPTRVARDQIASWIRSAKPLDQQQLLVDPVEIDVHYDGADLQDVAQTLGVTVQQVVDQHTSAEWTVAFSGFAPGFAYLRPPDGRLTLPRRESPRTRVPAGSVALAAGYTGIYPRSSPGGWHLIGHTDAILWDADRWDDAGTSPALLQPGAVVRFRPAQDRVLAVDAGARPAPIAQPGPHGTPALVVVTAGPLLTVQDLGRPGWAHVGVTGSGAADRGALRLANRLVGNAENAPGLEATLGGVTLRCEHRSALVAVTGARVPITINGTAHPDRTLLTLEPGDVVQIGIATRGLRAYLAVRGGFSVRHQLGSAATDVLGGLGPAPIQDGEILRTTADFAQAWPVIDHAPSGVSDDRVTLRAIPGPRDDILLDDALTTQEWVVSGDSDRVGVRLEGEPLRLTDQARLPSEPVVRGAIQVPHSGLPVLFLADHPVTGGYPVAGVLTHRSADQAAQLRPGDRVRISVQPASQR